MIFAKKAAKKIQFPEVGGKIQSVSRIKLSFGGNQVSFGLLKLDISIKTTKTETTMSTEGNNNTSPQEAPSPAASVPNVPTPAGPIGQGTNQPTYTTHSLNPTIGQVRITESGGGSDGGSDK